MVAADSDDGTLRGARAFPTLEDKGRQRLLEEHRVFLADDHYFGREWNTRGLAINTIESFFANLPWTFGPLMTPYRPSARRRGAGAPPA